MVHMPAESQGKNWKLSRPFHGPYRVLKVTPTNVEVRLVDHPKDEPIFVALNRVRLCYPEQGNTTWSGLKGSRRKPKNAISKPQKATHSTSTSDSSKDLPQPYSGPVTRSRSKL